MKKLRNHNSNKICILRSNPVNPDSRVEKEAAALTEAGFEVEIFCWDRESTHKIIKGLIHNKILVYRYGAKASYGGGMRNLKSYMRFQIKMFFWILKYGKNYSAIHACDFDTAFFSYIPSRLNRCKFVFDIFDYICGDPRNLLQKTVKRTENFLINHADATIICTEQRKEQIKGTKPKKLVVIHNSPDSNIKTTSPPVVVNKKNVSVVYVGVLLDNRLLVEMLEVFRNNLDIEFYIGGFGMLEEKIRDVAETYLNVHFLGKLTYEQTLSIEAECDIMTAIYDPSVENHRYAASNKFYESLMLGKPVLMAKGTGMSIIVRNHNIGELIDYSEEGFERGLKRLIARRDEWTDMSQRMKTIYKEEFNWDVMKKRLVAMHEELIS